MLFYQDNDMGMHEIFVLKSIYSVAIVVMELPSDWMTDNIGLSAAFLMAGGIYLVAAVAVSFPWLKSDK